MVIKLFSKLGDTARAVLTDDYAFDNKLTVKSTTQSGVTYSVVGVQGAGGAIGADFGVKFKLSPSVAGSILAGSAAANTITAKMNTAGRMSVESVLEDVAGVSGLKATLGGSATEEVHASSLLTEFIGAHVALSALAAVSGGSGAGGSDSKANEVSSLFRSTNVSGTLVTGAGGFAVGASADYCVNDGALTQYSAAVSYEDNGESEITLSWAGLSKALCASYSHVISKDMSVAAEIQHRRSTGATLLTVGGKFALDDVSTVKGKIDSHGGLCLAYVQEVRPNTTLTIASRVNMNQLDVGGHRVGVCLAYEG
ncbi:hypothetical protein CDCA_CDCA15G4098 [Cyanidium caldarium]|uniref:Uncharacterized protein n=1 Tax=Cyanidium caldarium TaxID=2771 RepID=A0AAV9J153_CYACA|nr:hypothetical protein CDCA_CDCA15G4098 [Cyanidium caldarium]